MGHAWCEVWQEDTGWKVEDHTGAASALENVERERASSDTWQQIRKAIFQCFEGNRRYTSGVRTDNIAGVDTDCAETENGVETQDQSM